MARPLVSMHAHSGTILRGADDADKELSEAIMASCQGYSEAFRKFFTPYDKSGEGLLNELVFRRIVRGLGIHGPTDALNRAIETATDPHTGMVSYDRFLAQFSFKGDAPPEGASTTNSYVHTRILGSHTSAADSSVEMSRTRSAVYGDYTGVVDDRAIAGAPSERTDYNLQAELKKEGAAQKAREDALGTELGVSLKLIATQIAQKGSCVKVFRTKFDRGHNGSITRQQFLLGVRYLGIPSDLVSNEDIDEIYNAFCSADGTLSVFEFETLVHAGEEGKVLTRMVQDRQARSTRDARHDVAVLLESGKDLGASRGERRPLRREGSAVNIGSMHASELGASTTANVGASVNASKAIGAAASSMQANLLRFSEDQILAAIKRRIASICTNKFSSFGDCMANAQDYNRKVTPESLRKFIVAQAPELCPEYAEKLLGSLVTQEKLRQYANSLGVNAADISPTVVASQPDPSHISAVVFNELYKLPGAADSGKQRLDEEIWAAVTLVSTTEAHVVSKAALQQSLAHHQRNQYQCVDDPPTPLELSTTAPLSRSRAQSRAAFATDPNAYFNADAPDAFSDYTQYKNDPAGGGTPSGRRLRQSMQRMDMLASSQTPLGVSGADRSAELHKIRLQLIDAMNGRKTALAEAVALAATQAHDPAAFRDYLYDFTRESLTPHQVQYVLDGAVDGATGRIDRYVVLRNLRLDRDYSGDVSASVQPRKADFLSNDMVCMSAVREKMQGLTEKHETYSKTQRDAAARKQHSSIMDHVGDLTEADLAARSLRAPSTGPIPRHMDSSGFSNVIYDMEKHVTDEYEQCLQEATDSVVRGNRRRAPDSATRQTGSLMVSGGGICSTRDSQLAENEAKIRRVRNTQRLVSAHGTPSDVTHRHGKAMVGTRSQLGESVGAQLQAIDAEYLLDYQENLSGGARSTAFEV
ncbi:hypothetical protein GMRT_10979 [Giardia muris]|uniref:Actin related protein n=1 Tax=Giardia muris TaxID=5742 RepID=A0A4Z1STZ7_GIAMU|nr:hypothetical protein GMRT_10979 [Giardia muris]|eukprot:TNJ29334.1 hypothetical protein GMRT_10979 [Giardia muris]